MDKLLQEVSTGAITPESAIDRALPTETRRQQFVNLLLQKRNICPVSLQAQYKQRKETGMEMEIEKFLSESRRYLGL